MGYLGVCDPMLMDGVRGPGSLYVFADGWVLLGMKDLEGDLGSRAKLGHSILMGGGGAVGGAVGGLVGGIKRTKVIAEARKQIEAEGDALTARDVADRFGGLLTPVDAVASARLQKDKLKARKLLVTTHDGDEQLLKFGHKSALFDLLPPLLGDRWVDEMAE